MGFSDGAAVVTNQTNTDMKRSRCWTHVEHVPVTDVAFVFTRLSLSGANTEVAELSTVHSEPSVSELNAAALRICLLRTKLSLYSAATCGHCAPSAPGLCEERYISDRGRRIFIMSETFSWTHS